MSSTRRRRATADRLHSAAIRLLRGVRRVDAAMGLGPAKSSALSVLVFGGPRSAGALAAAEGVKPPSLTRVIRELEADGLIRRRPDPRDGRAVTLEATAKARRTLEAGRARRTSLLAEWLATLDPMEARTLEQALPVLEKIVRPTPPSAP